MTRRLTNEEYTAKLLAKGILATPLETFKSYPKKIKHLCPCGAEFLRAPAHMLMEHSTGSCKECSGAIRRKNKLKTPDNGYLDYLISKNFSLPVDINDYVDRHTKIKHKCKLCSSEWFKTPAKALRKSYLGVCPKCTEILKGKNRATPLSTFISMLQTVSTETTYAGKYKDITSVAAFNCKCGNVFERMPTKVLAGSLSCIPCTRSSQSTLQLMSPEEHESKMTDRKFETILLSEKIGTNTEPLQYLCSCGEVFERSPAHMFKKGAYGVCGTCKKNRNTKRFSRTEEQYDKLLLKKRPGIVRIGPYQGNYVNVQHKCVCGNTDWNPRPNNVLQSYDTCGCALGNKSERVIRQIFEQVFGCKFPSSRPDFLLIKKNKSRLQLDGFNADLMIGFEHHGSQHYTLNSKFHKAQADLKNNKTRDKKKAALCRKHYVVLVVIPSIEKKLRRMRGNETVLQEVYQNVLKLIMKKIILPQTFPSTVTIDWALVDYNPRQK